MKEFIEKLIGRLEEEREWAITHGTDASFRKGRISGFNTAKRIVNQLAEEYINTSTDTSSGWVACSERLPPQPKENPLFEYKPLEVYLVSLSSTDYPWRAFWNGKYFTDGFSKVEPIAWMPLPAPYKEGCE